MFALTSGLIVLDVVLRLLVIEKQTALTRKPKMRHVISWKVDPFQKEPEDSRLKLTKVQFQVSIESIEADSMDWNDAPITITGRKSRSQCLPPILTLLSSRRLLSALWGVFVMGTIFSGLETVLPLETEALFGWGSLGGGLIFLPIGIPTLFGPIVGYLCDRYGPRWPTFSGFLVLCPALILFRLIDDNKVGLKVLLVVLLTLVGTCFTFTLDPLMAEIAYVVAHKANGDIEKARYAYAQAFALFNMAYSLGNVVGPLSAGFIRDDTGWGTMGWVLGLWSGVTASIAVLWTGGWLWKQNGQRGHREQAMEVGLANRIRRWSLV